MLWVLREVFNAMTCILPYKVVYSRKPKGPLVIFKELWTGESSTSSGMGQPVENCLTLKLHWRRQLQNSHC